MNFNFRPDILYWNIATERHDILKLVSDTEFGVNTKQENAMRYNNRYNLLQLSLSLEISIFLEPYI